MCVKQNLSVFLFFSLSFSTVAIPESPLKKAIKCFLHDKTPGPLGELSTVFLGTSTSVHPKEWDFALNLIMENKKDMLPVKQECWEFLRVVFYPSKRTLDEEKFLDDLGTEIGLIGQEQLTTFTLKLYQSFVGWPLRRSFFHNNLLWYSSLLCADRNLQPYQCAVMFTSCPVKDKELTYYKQWAQFYVKGFDTPESPKAKLYSDFVQWVCCGTPPIYALDHPDSPFSRAFKLIRDKPGANACPGLLSHIETFPLPVEIAEEYFVYYFQKYLVTHLIEYLEGINFNPEKTLTAIGQILSLKNFVCLGDEQKNLLYGLRVYVLCEQDKVQEAMTEFQGIDKKKLPFSIVRSCACSLMLKEKCAEARKLLEQYSATQERDFWLTICDALTKLLSANSETEADFSSDSDENPPQCTGSPPVEIPPEKVSSVPPGYHAQPQRVPSYAEQLQRAKKKREQQKQKIQALITHYSNPVLTPTRISLQPNVFAVMEQLFGVAKEGRVQLTWEDIEHFIKSIGGMLDGTGERIKISFPPKVLDKQEKNSKQEKISFDKNHGSRSSGIFDPSDNYHHRLITLLKFSGYDSSSFEVMTTSRQ